MDSGGQGLFCVDRTEESQEDLMVRVPFERARWLISVKPNDAFFTVFSIM